MGTIGAGLALLASVCAAGCRMPGQPAGSLRTFGELARLPERELATGRRVDLRGVVTPFDPDWQLLVMQDGASATLVERLLRVRGVSLPVYSPSGTRDQVRVMFENEADVDVLDPPP